MPAGPAFDRLRGLRNDSFDSANNLDASGKHFNRFGVKQEIRPPNLHEDLPDGAVGWLRNLGFGGGRSESKIVAKVPFWASFLAPPGSNA